MSKFIESVRMFLGEYLIVIAIVALVALAFYSTYRDDKEYQQTATGLMKDCWPTNMFVQTVIGLKEVYDCNE